ncbi:hypothetical protein [Comamonas sp. GB3 AK4-5]|uniref:hypothetical protein n=1 Tax=Comamonas sp. GB3 AK4-5 TaxID=3231487 RepID=UPI00351F1507
MNTIFHPAYRGDTETAAPLPTQDCTHPTKHRVRGARYQRFMTVEKKSTTLLLSSDDSPKLTAGIQVFTINTEAANAYTPALSMLFHLGCYFLHALTALIFVSNHG